MTQAMSFTLTLDRAPMRSALVDAVQEIVVETAIDLAGTVALRFGMAPTTTGDWSVLDDDPFRPLTPLGVGFSLDGGSPHTAINAFVTAQEASWEEGGRSYLEVRGTDATVLMNLEEKVKAWENVSDSEMASSILGDYGLDPQVHTTDARLADPEGTTMQRGTDLRFLRRLARRNGFGVYVLPDAQTGADRARFEPPTLTGRAPTVLSVAMGAATNVAELQVRYDMIRPTTVVAAGLDTAKKATQSESATEVATKVMGKESALSHLLDGGHSVVVRPFDTGALTTAELGPMAQAVTDLSSMAVVIEGRTGPDVGLLRPGQLVALRGAGRQYNGNYLLSQVRITAGPGRFEQRFTARRNAVQELGAESAGAAGAAGATA